MSLDEFMNKNDIIQIVKKCIDGLYSDNGDMYLFDCMVCERCLMFRLAYYLQMEFPNYFVDAEFNKMGFFGYKHANKVEPIRNSGKLKKMYVDIIIHKRNSNTKNNFICLEVKRAKRGMNNDLERLKMMTKQNGFMHNGINYIYAYDFGVFVYIPRDKANAEIRIFQNGEELSNH